MTSGAAHAAAPVLMASSGACTRPLPPGVGWRAEGMAGMLIKPAAGSSCAAGDGLGEGCAAAAYMHSSRTDCTP